MNNKARLSNCKRDESNSAPDFNRLGGNPPSQSNKNFFFKVKSPDPAVSPELSKKELKLFFKNLYKLKEITLTQKHIMLMMLKIWQYKGLFPKYEEIAEKTGKSLATVKRVLRDMRLLGYINWKNKWVGRKQTSNRYFFTVTKKLFQKIIEKIKFLFKAHTAKKALENSHSHRVSERPSSYNYNKYNYNNTECSEQKNSDRLLKSLELFRKEKTEKTYPKQRKEKHVSLRKKIQKLLNQDIRKGTKFLQRFGSPEHHHYLNDLEKIEQVLDRLLPSLNPKKSQLIPEFQGQGTS